MSTMFFRGSGTMSCTTCGSPLKEQKLDIVKAAVSAPSQIPSTVILVESEVNQQEKEPDPDPDSNIDPNSNPTSTPADVTTDSSASEQLPQELPVTPAVATATNNSKPKVHFFDFDPKFMVDPIKFATAVTYFLPRGVTPEIQAAIGSYQLPFCSECIDIIDRVCTIENEIDSLYQLLDSLISCFKYKIQLTLKNESETQTEGKEVNVEGPEEQIWKLRASLVGLNSWNGIPLQSDVKGSVGFHAQSKSNRSGNHLKSKDKPTRRQQMSKKNLSPQLLNKKRQYRESVIKKINSATDTEALPKSKKQSKKGKDRRTTTMHYDYLAISSDSNSTVELNPTPTKAESLNSEATTENLETPTTDVPTRKSSRLESKTSGDGTPTKRPRKSRINEEEFETNLSDIVSEDEAEEILGLEDDEEDDKEWHEDDELEETDGEGEEEEEEDEEYEEDEEGIKMELESATEEDMGEQDHPDGTDNETPNGLETDVVNEKVVRFQKYRENKLQMKAKNKGKRFTPIPMPIPTAAPMSIPLSIPVQKKFNVTDVGDGVFEYKSFKFMKIEEDKFQCDACNKIFKARSNVIAHINLKHLEQQDNRRAIITPSGKVKMPPKRKTDRRQRQVTQLGPGLFKFEERTFSLREDGRYQCGSCPNTLKTRDSVLVHIKQRHLGEGLGIFLCHQCGKSFDRDVYLKLHEISHSTNKKLHQCSTCGKTFTQVSNLYNHRKIHTGELNHHCDFEGCGKKFLTRKQLTVHMKRHLGDRPYECDLCPKKFVRSSELVIHMRSHSEERPYECRLCESKFFIKYRLNRHLKRVHHIDEPVVILESGDAPIRIITTSIHNNIPGPTSTAELPVVSTTTTTTTTTHVPVNVTLDPQNPLHHFLTLTDLF